jgi:hypothetical protein
MNVANESDTRDHHAAAIARIRSAVSGRGNSRSLAEPALSEVEELGMTTFNHLPAEVTRRARRLDFLVVAMPGRRPGPTASPVGILKTPA